MIEIAKFAEKFIRIPSDWSINLYVEEIYGSLYLKNHFSSRKTDTEGKIIYLGDSQDELRDLRDNVTKAEWKKVKKEIGPWKWFSNPKALRYLVLDENEIFKHCSIGLIDSDDEIRFIPEIWDENRGVVRPAQWATKKALVKFFEKDENVCVRLL